MASVSGFLEGLGVIRRTRNSRKVYDIGMISSGGTGEHLGTHDADNDLKSKQVI